MAVDFQGKEVVFYNNAEFFQCIKSPTKKLGFLVAQSIRRLDDPINPDVYLRVIKDSEDDSKFFNGDASKAI